MAHKTNIQNLPSVQNVRLYISPNDIAPFLQEFALQPRLAWKRVFASSDTWQQVFEKYVFFFAAIPVVSRLIGQVLFAGAPIVRSVLFAVVGYLLSVIFFIVATFIAHRSVEVFDGKLSLDTAAKLIVYSFMPFFVAGIFFILPPISVLFVVGFYSFYLFYLGIESASGIPKTKQLAFFMMNVVSWLVIAGLFIEAI